MQPNAIARIIVFDERQKCEAHTHRRTASGRSSVLVRLVVAPSRRRGILLRSLFDLRRCQSDNALPYRGRSRGRVYDAVLTFFASSARCSCEDFSWTRRAQLPCVLQFDICFTEAVSLPFYSSGSEPVTAFSLQVAAYDTVLSLVSIAARPVPDIVTVNPSVCHWLTSSYKS